MYSNCKSQLLLYLEYDHRLIEIIFNISFCSNTLSHLKLFSISFFLFTAGYKYSDDTPVDPHDHSFENSAHNDHTNGPKLEEVHANYAYVQVKPP